MSLVVFGWELHHQQIPRFQAAPASPDYVQISSRDRGSFRANVGPPRRLEQDACFAGLQLGASFVSHTHTPTHLPKTIFLCLLYSSIYHRPTLLISRQTHVANHTHKKNGRCSRDSPGDRPLRSEQLQPTTGIESLQAKRWTQIPKCTIQLQATGGPRSDRHQQDLARKTAQRKHTVLEGRR